MNWIGPLLAWLEIRKSDDRVNIYFLFLGSCRHKLAWFSLPCATIYSDCGLVCGAWEQFTNQQLSSALTNIKPLFITEMPGIWIVSGFMYDGVSVEAGPVIKMSL